MPPRPAPASSSVHSWVDHSCRHKPLCQRTVIELSRRIQRWQNHPDGPAHAPKALRRSGLRARQQLVRHNLSLVAYTLRRNRHGISTHDDSSADALQEGALNLVRAAEKFDPAKGYTFSCYATFWVRRGFSDYQRRSCRLIQFPVERGAVVLKAERLAAHYLADTGQEPSLEWLVSQLSFQGKPLRVDQLLLLRQQWEETRTRSLDGADHLESEDSHVQRLEKASLQAAELQEQASAEDPQLAMLPALMGVLDELEERLIRNLYLRRPPFTPYQLRKSMGQMSEESLKQMEAEALRKLRAAAQEFQRHSSR